MHALRSILAVICSFLITGAFYSIQAQVVGGGFSYKFLGLANDQYTAGFNAVGLQGYYQIDNLTEIGEREIYIGADWVLPVKFSPNNIGAKLEQKIFTQLNISFSSVKYLTGNEETPLSFVNMFQAQIPITYMNTLITQSKGDFNYGNGVRFGFGLQEGLGARVGIDASWSIITSLFIGLNALNLAGVISDDYPALGVYAGLQTKVVYALK